MLLEKDVIVAGYINIYLSLSFGRGEREKIRGAERGLELDE